MKHPILLTSVLVGSTLAAVAACDSALEDPAPMPEPKAGDTTITDAAADAVPADAGIDSQPDSSLCSSAGWCPTALPNPDFLVQDIWPFEDRAFAVGISPTLGVKVMEWTAATDAWSYIDDETQHDTGLGDYVGTIWAPNENELYYTVSPGYVYHGTRGTDWTWTRQQLTDNGPTFTAKQNGNPTLYLGPGHASYQSYPALGVFGLGANDVYAWFTNTIFHWKDDGTGTAAWVAEYTIELPTALREMTSIFSAGASASGEMWFAGARTWGYGACALVIHKSASGYSRIADGTVVNGGLPTTAACATKPGYLALGGPMLNIQSTPSGRIVGLDYTPRVVEFLPAADDGDWSLRPSKSALDGVSSVYLSMWAPSDAEFWLSGDGLVVRGNDVFQDGGTWEVSSIAENGAPIRQLFYRVRGTSTSNIWAVGNGYALHKTAAP